MSTGYAMAIFGLILIATAVILGSLLLLLKRRRRRAQRVNRAATSGDANAKPSTASSSLSDGTLSKPASTTPTLPPTLPRHSHLSKEISSFQKDIEAGLDKEIIVETRRPARPRPALLTVPKSGTADNERSSRYGPKELEAGWDGELPLPPSPTSPRSKSPMGSPKSPKSPGLRKSWRFSRGRSPRNSRLSAGFQKRDTVRLTFFAW